ncbi:MAG: hypothetical protein H6707_07145 [Deltaproteobacteria bacterium]|nr:hypothetical protein [Deltaproteobacteria bacterium]
MNDKLEPPKPGKPVAGQAKGPGDFQPPPSSGALPGQPGYVGPGVGQDPYRTPAPGTAPVPADNKAVISMVLGIIGAMLCCLPLVGPVAGTIAIVLYVKYNAVYRASGGMAGGRGMAIAGLVCGIVACAMGLIYTLYWMVAGALIGAAGRGLL